METMTSKILILLFAVISGLYIPNLVYGKITVRPSGVPMNEETSTVPNQPVPSNTNTSEKPEMISIPNTMESLLNLSLNYPRHEGIKESFKAIQQSRSMKNVYILAIKSIETTSNMQNNLLKHEIPQKAVDVPSITEFISANIQLKELGIQNCNLHIILLSCESNNTEANYTNFIATFLKFLEDHDELSNVIPNAVLIPEPNAEYNSGLKIWTFLQPFKELFTDEFNSNIIPMSMSIQANRNNENVTSGQNSQTNPKLFFSDNEINQLKEMFQNNSDLIAFNLFSEISKPSAKMSIQFNSTQIPILTNNIHEKFQYVSQIPSISNDCSTEISKTLEDAYERIDWNLKRKYPGSLQLLQNVLNKRNITRNSQIPATTKELIIFLQSLSSQVQEEEEPELVLLNPLTLILLQNAFPLRIPEMNFQPNQLIGIGYDLTADISVEETPFDFYETSYSPKLGVLIPKAFEIIPILEQELIYFNFHHDLNSFINSRLVNLNVTNINYLNESNFNGELKSRENIILNLNSAAAASTIQVIAIKEIRKFQFVLNSKPKFKYEFLNKISDMPLFDIHNQKSVDKWKEFIFDYGTHIVSSCFIGGFIEVKIDVGGNELIKLKSTGNISSTEMFAKLVLENPAMFGRNHTNHNIYSDFKVQSIKLNGGDNIYQVENLARLNTSEIAGILAGWKKSLNYESLTLDINMNLIALSDFIKTVNKTVAKELTKAAKASLEGTLEYIPLTLQAHVSTKSSQIVANQHNSLTEEELSLVQKKLEATSSKLNKITPNVFIPTKEDYEENNDILDCLHNIIEALDLQIQSTAASINTQNLTDLANHIESFYNRIAQIGSTKPTEKNKIKKICNEFMESETLSKQILKELEKFIDEEVRIPETAASQQQQQQILVFPEIHEPTTKEMLNKDLLLKSLTKTVWANSNNNHNSSTSTNSAAMRLISQQQITDFKFIGCGYNLYLNNITKSTPFILTENSFNKIQLNGFEIPKMTFKYFGTKYEYLKTYLNQIIPSSSLFLLSQLATTSKIPTENYMKDRDMKILPGFNTILNEEPLSIVFEFRKYLVKLKSNEMHFNEDFRIALTHNLVNLTANERNNYNYTYCNIENKWKLFFGKYGTQIVSEAYLGGAIEIKVFNQTKLEILKMRNEPKKIKSLVLSEIFLNKSDISFNVYGGNSSLLFLRENEVTKVKLENWIQSIHENLAVLPINIKLENLYKVVKQQMPELNANILFGSLNTFYQNQNVGIRQNTD